MTGPASTNKDALLRECAERLRLAGIPEGREFVNSDEQRFLARITAALADESGGWIPVGERLPEKNTDCLVFLGWVDIGTYEPPHKTRSHSESWFSEPAGVHPMFNVTYWRSLPPLPKGADHG